MLATERHQGCVVGYLYSLWRCIADWRRKNRRDLWAKTGTRDESRHTEEPPGDTKEAGWVVCVRM